MPYSKPIKHEHPSFSLGIEYFRGIDQIDGMYAEPSRRARVCAKLGSLSFGQEAYDALHRLSLRENMKRMTHEQATVGTLMELNPERLIEYQKYAGDPSQVPAFVDYFAKLSERYSNKSILGTYKGPSFSLGYEVQAGIWDDNVQHEYLQLDETIRQLPEQLRNLEYAKQYTLTVRSRRSNLLSYKLSPVKIESSKRVELLLLERRRAVADIEVVGTKRKIDIAKRACAMVVVDALPESTRENTRQYLAGIRPDPDKELDQSVAIKVGNVFERARKQGARDNPNEFLGILPESMTYFIRERR